MTAIGITVFLSIGFVLWLYKRVRPKLGPPKDSSREPTLKWSGNPTGEFSIKSLTQDQWSCLMTLSKEGRVVPDNTPHEKGVHHYANQTISSLMKHGFVVKSETGQLQITDHGLNAYENLRWR